MTENKTPTVDELLASANNATRANYTILRARYEKCPYPYLLFAVAQHGDRPSPYVVYLYENLVSKTPYEKPVSKNQFGNIIGEFCSCNRKPSFENKAGLTF